MMDKTIKINLGGTLFQIDEEAYNILRQYLQGIDARLKHTPEGAEILEDIELRIAEIFQSQGGTAGVINRENVESMIAIIGKPETFDNSGEEKEFETPPYQSAVPKKLYRNPDDMIISGVSSGIATYLGIESVWIRLLFVIFSCFFGIGIFIYLALWLAVPVAKTDPEKKEMYGNSNYSTVSRNRRRGNSAAANDPAYNRSYSTGSDIGNAFNEIFRALGKVAFVIVRIFLIIVGVCLVVTGFAGLISSIMIFFLNYPQSFSTHTFEINLFYLPDFLNYVVSPEVAPWITALSFVIILIPLLVFIYLGVKMIFWFKAKDGLIGLLVFVIWVMSVVALSIILFNEGISFAETGKTETKEVIERPPATIYILGSRKVADLQYENEIAVQEEDYNIYLPANSKDLYVGTRLGTYSSDNNSLEIDVRKRSTGSDSYKAETKAKSLSYNYRIAGDTIFIDEYFTIPEGSKWSFDNVGINVFIPVGTIVRFDNTTENMYYKYRQTHERDFRDHDFDIEFGSRDGDYGYDYSGHPDGDHIWVMTKYGLEKSPETKK